MVENQGCMPPDLNSLPPAAHLFTNTSWKFAQKTNFFCSNTRLCYCFPPRTETQDFASLQYWRSKNYLLWDIALMKLRIKMKKINVFSGTTGHLRSMQNRRDATSCVSILSNEAGGVGSFAAKGRFLKKFDQNFSWIINKSFVGEFCTK